MRYTATQHNTTYYLPALLQVIRVRPSLRFQKTPATALKAFILLCFLATGLAANAADMVNINRADAATMIENWKGIGEVKAKAIVAYRKKNGPFKSIDDLANVKGIGEGLLKKNRKLMSTSKGAVKPTGKAKTNAGSRSNNVAAKKSDSKKQTTAKKSTQKKSDSGSSKKSSSKKKDSKSGSKSSSTSGKAKKKSKSKKKSKTPAT